MVHLLTPEISQICDPSKVCKEMLGFRGCGAERNHFLLFKTVMIVPFTQRVIKGTIQTFLIFLLESPFFVYS